MLLRILCPRLTWPLSPRRWQAGLVGGVLAAALMGIRPTRAIAVPGMVVAQGNQVYLGDIDATSTPGKLVITSKGGIKTTVDQRIVDKVTYFNGPREEYDARMARLKADDVAGRLAVAQWATDAKELDCVREALASARAIDPDNAEGKAAWERVNKQITTTRPAAVTRPAAAEVGVKHTGPSAAARWPVRQVTANEINTIRQLEWRGDDRSVRARVPPDVRKRFIDMNAVPPNEVTNPNDLAYAILQHGTPAMQEEVQIQNDPAPLAEFRQKVEKVLQQGCIQCHTIGKVDKDNDFVLYPGNTDADVYSNFLILQKYSKSMSADPRRPDREVEYSMIDRLRPDASLLVQFALPPDLALLPHPPAKGYTGVIRTKSDAKYRELIAWIRGLSPLAPNYGVDLWTEEKPADKPPAGHAAAPVPHR